MILGFNALFRFKLGLNLLTLRDVLLLERLALRAVALLDGFDIRLFLLLKRLQALFVLGLEVVERLLHRCIGGQIARFHLIHQSGALVIDVR